MRLLRRFGVAGLVVIAATMAGHAGAVEPSSGIECTVVVEAKTGRQLVRDGDCDHRLPPMSTFKLPIAIMGYDMGILKSDHDPLWPYRKAYGAPKRARKSVDPAIWQAESIVWYSQEVTRRLGAEAFARYVTAFGYGNRDVSDRNGRPGLTESWLMSSLEISPDEQVVFLAKFVNGALPVSQDAQRKARAITPQFRTDGWLVHGKTGSGWLRNSLGAVDYERPLGWFVGWAERDGRRVVFARMRVEAGKAVGPSGLRLREEFLAELPGLMKGR